MSVILNGSSQYLSVAQAVLTANPLTIAAWFKSTSQTAEQCIASVGVSGANTCLGRVKAHGATTGDPVQAETRTATLGSVAATTTAYTANTWHHACGVFTSNTSRDAFIDGGSKGSSTVSRIGSADQFIVGAAGALGLLFAGNIAHVAVWNIALSDGDVATLAAGADPQTIQAGNLVAYWTLSSDGSPTVGALTLVATGSPTFDAGDDPISAYIDAEATIVGTGAIVATGETAETVEAAASITGTGSVTAYATANLINTNNRIILVALGHDELWFEDS